MPIFHAIVLGLVQGLTEFLPISSSGHLLIVPWLLDWNDFDEESVKKTFDVALHLGTFVAVLGYFWRDVTVYVRDGTKLLFTRGRTTTPEGRLAWMLLLATVPAAAVGAVFEGTIDERLGTPGIIAVSLIVFGVLLGWADRSTGERKLEGFGPRDALITGAAQTLALNPGTSRSGITVTAGRFLGFDRDAAVRISFLMSLPVIAGAVLFKTFGAIKDGIPEDLIVPMIVGIVTSGIAGWLAVWGTLRLVRNHSLMLFVWYRIILGVVILLVMATGLR
jgi:undecaprenyl-diphosphatase